MQKLCVDTHCPINRILAIVFFKTHPYTRCRFAREDFIDFLGPWSLAHLTLNPDPKPILEHNSNLKPAPKAQIRRSGYYALK